MSNYVVASGEQLFEAAIEGAKRKFNRSTDDYSVYERLFNEYYELMLDDKTNKSACKRIRKQTKNSWKNANLCIELLMIHNHRAMQICESHARVYLMGIPHKVFDIPLEYYLMFEKQSQKSA